MIHTATGEQLKSILQKALQKEEMAITIDNRAMVRRFATEDLNLVGIGLRGKKNQVDKLLKGIPLKQISLTNTKRTLGRYQCPFLL